MIGGIQFGFKRTIHIEIWEKEFITIIVIKNVILPPVSGGKNKIKNKTNLN